ncbi:MAG: hypothetical protein NTW21_07165 [Verrucomicrobia bacterium]|nr:hypothetical protein [Verrucomicrobiota bacterium]
MGKYFDTQNTQPFGDAKKIVEYFAQRFLAEIEMPLSEGFEV